MSMGQEGVPAQAFVHMGDCLAVTTSREERLHDAFTGSRYPVDMPDAAAGVKGRKGEAYG